jgi:hypothetical protein
MSNLQHGVTFSLQNGMSALQPLEQKIALAVKIQRRRL